MRRCSTRLTVSPRSNLVGVCECGFGHVPSLWGSLPCRTAMYVGSVGNSYLHLFTYMGDGVSARLVSRASFR